MGPSRYDHLILLPFSPYRASCMRGGCDDLKKTIGGTQTPENPATICNRKHRTKPMCARLTACALFLTAHRRTGLTTARGSRQESFRVISTARLRTLPPVHLPPINVVVCNDPNGDLILRLASCLDAFSTYPYPTRLPGRAPGGTTGWPEVGPTRSSRTSVRSPQISNAHNR